ncbi:MAG: hypothetical protein H0T68_05825 [Gemmatimonadales bacterium]|nr:hypothetical protein [Gemmatimonadales bacterium]
MTAAAQWVQQSDQFYLPAEHNWAFRDEYAAADRLFNAFDYGHAILYEKLYTRQDAPVSLLEEEEYDFITRELLVHPPRVPLEEGAIEIAYSKIAPEAKMMFDWAHVLHRQIYDVWADEGIPPDGKDARVAELLRYYRSRADIAFSSVPKNMDLMEGQDYSLAFRREYPKFNGLIWAYHWLQVGLYEPLVTGKTVADRQTGVLAAVARFKQMLEHPPEDMPRLMPMTAAIAPEFARRYPEAAIIFDNLHAMHDVISDVLASPDVPRNRKREEILKAGRRYRDSTSFAWTEQEWRAMSRMMGVENMGGVAVGFLDSLPTPSVAVGASHADAMRHAESGGEMAGMDHSRMPGMQADSDHSAMGHSTGKERPDSRSSMMQMHRRMMADTVIRQRIMADTAMRRMMLEMQDAAKPEKQDRVPGTTRPPAEPSDTTASPEDHGAMEHGDTPAMKENKPRSGQVSR